MLNGHLNTCLTLNLNRLLNVKALVGTFNQEKALVVAISVIVQLRRLIVCSTTCNRNLQPGTRFLPPTTQPPS